MYACFSMKNKHKVKHDQILICEFLRGKVLVKSTAMWQICSMEFCTLSGAIPVISYASSTKKIWDGKGEASRICSYSSEQRHPRVFHIQYFGIVLRPRSRIGSLRETKKWSHSHLRSTNLRLHVR